MPQLKSFPKKIRIGMSMSGDLTIMPDLIPPELMIAGGIRRLAFYVLENNEEVPVVTPRPTRRTRRPQSEKTPTDMPLLQDNAPMQAVERKNDTVKVIAQNIKMDALSIRPRKRKKGRKSTISAKYKCEDCGMTFDEPDMATDGTLLCPECSSDAIRALTKNS